MGIIAQKLSAGTSTQPGTEQPTGVIGRILANQKPKEPGFVQGLAQDIAKPFLGFASQARDVGRIATGEQLTKDQQEYDYGYLGKVKSFGAVEANPLSEQSLNAVKPAVGAGLGVASNIAPGGTLKTIGKGILPKIGRAAVEGAIGGSLYGTGSGLQEGDDVGSSLMKGLGYGLGGATIAGSIPIAGKGFGKVKDLVVTPGEKKLESMMLDKFSSAVKPTVLGKKSLDQVDKYNKNVLSGIRTISENEPNLSFLGDEGDVIVGRSPQSLKQLMEGIEQTKKTVFTQYDNLAKTAGGNGLNVEFTPIVKELDGVINNKALQLSNPKAVEYAIQTRDRFLRAGKVDATTAQNIVQNYNKALEAFYRNPTYDNATQVAIDAMAANNIRKSLDEGIEGLTGKAYQELKNKYGSLKTIEKDVIKAFLRDERKSTKGLIDFTDIFSGGQVVNGILALNPATIGQGLAAKGIASFYKMLNDPNRAVKKIFELANKLPDQAKKQVKPRLLLEAPRSNIRSEVRNQSVIPLGKLQSKVDAEMVAKFGRKYEQIDNELKSIFDMGVRETEVGSISSPVFTKKDIQVVTDFLNKQPDASAQANTEKLSSLVDQQKALIDYLDETVGEQIKRLQKFEGKSGEFKGQLNLNNGKGKFGKEGDTILREVFGDTNNRFSSEELVEKYYKLKNTYKNAKEVLKTLKGTQKTSSQAKNAKPIANTIASGQATAQSIKNMPNDITSSMSGTIPLKGNSTSGKLPKTPPKLK